jgi:single-strand DNA-binding protein
MLTNINKLNNSVNLIGSVGAAPEIRFSRKSGKKFATFSISTKEYWPDSNNVRKYIWHKIIVFSPNMVNYVQRNLKKGSHVAIEGELTHSSYWVGAEQKISVQVNASEITVLTRQMQDVLRQQENRNRNSSNNENCPNEDFEATLNRKLDRLEWAEQRKENERLEQ